MFNVEEYKPLKGKALLKLQTSEEFTTESGLIIPVTPEEFLTRAMRTAYVLSLGEGADVEASDGTRLKVGDKVSIRRYDGKTVKIAGLEYVLIKATEIEGIH